MKDIINYYYDIKIDRLEVKNKCSIIESHGRTLIVKKMITQEEIEKIIPNLTNNFYKIILTKNNNYYFEYNNEIYIMFEIYEASKEKLNNLDIILVYQEIEPDYAKIWQNNIDYYMSYISSNGVEHKELLNDFNYYIGMAENAITIFNSSKRMNSKARQSISHYRIHYPNYYLYYYDPTELTIDYISRDIAGYIKSKFYVKGISIQEVLELIKKYQLTEKEICILIARLVYPNFYFDFIKENSHENKKNTYNIIKKREEYEKFLKALLNQIKTTNLSININWL